MRLLATILALVCIEVGAAPTNLVTITCTNVINQPDTNVIKVFPINTPINADGTYFVTGTPFRVIPDTNGVGTITNLQPGAYAATNPGLGSVVFAIPNLSGSYDAAQPGIALSGSNKYNYSPGVIQIVPGAGTTVSPLNGIGVVTINAGGSNSGVFSSVWSTNMPSGGSISHLNIATGFSGQKTKLSGPLNEFVEWDDTEPGINIGPNLFANIIGSFVGDGAGLTNVPVIINSNIYPTVALMPNGAATLWNSNGVHGYWINRLPAGALVTNVAW
jgi:hypothetical protein